MNKAKAERDVVSIQDLRTKAKGKAKVAKLVQGSNAYLGLIELDPGATVPLHRDVTEEYLYLLKGSGVITIDGDSFDLEKGSTVYMPPNAEVSYKNSEEETTRFIQIFAGPQPASKYKNWKDFTFSNGISYQW